VIEEKQMLKSRLDKYAKEAAAGKRVKMRRYKMMACSVGVSAVVFAVYSIIVPVKARERAVYVKPDNQAISLPLRAIDITIQKEELDKSDGKREEEMLKSSSDTQIKKNTKAVVKPTAPSHKVESKKTSPSTLPATNTREKQKEDGSLETYPKWNKKKTYQAGDRVMYKDRVYEANKENKNAPPDERHFLFGSAWDEVK
jgi:hypothetical protein